MRGKARRADGRCARGPDGTRKIRLDGFFFQAEDGIRDKLVTGVQTCALPICELGQNHRRQEMKHHRLELTRGKCRKASVDPESKRTGAEGKEEDGSSAAHRRRSEERRGGKARRPRTTAYPHPKTQLYLLRLSA